MDAEEHVDDDFMLILSDYIFRANQAAVVNRHQGDSADTAFLNDEASRYGVCNMNDYDEIKEVVEKPDDPPSNRVMMWFYTFLPAIFHACKLVQPSYRDEYDS